MVAAEDGVLGDTGDDSACPFASWILFLGWAGCPATPSLIPACSSAETCVGDLPVPGTVPLALRFVPRFFSLCDPKACCCLNGLDGSCVVGASVITDGGKVIEYDVGRISSSESFLRRVRFRSVRVCQMLRDRVGEESKSWSRVWSPSALEPLLW